ncbi:endo-1,4-beta-xylanase [Seiridium cupressi]
MNSLLFAAFFLLAGVLSAPSDLIPASALDPDAAQANYYCWTRNPLIVYYIVDAHGDLSPGEPWTAKGNFPFEEGTYQLYTSTRVDKPSIIGTATFQQFWSVRTEWRVGGAITTGNHFDAWNAAGRKLGGHDYMILATEGYTVTGRSGSSGTASITLD